MLIKRDHFYLATKGTINYTGVEKAWAGLIRNKASSLF